MENKKTTTKDGKAAAKEKFPGLVQEWENLSEKGVSFFFVVSDPADRDLYLTGANGRSEEILKALVNAFQNDPNMGRIAKAALVGADQLSEEVLLDEMRKEMERRAKAAEQAN